MASFLDGDGRFSLRPPPGAVGMPLAISRAQARRVVALFEAQGRRPWYSSFGGTLWLIARYLDEQGVRYAVTPSAHGGWQLSVTEEPAHEPSSNSAA